MTEFVITPAIEWLESEFIKRQSGDRQRDLEIYGSVVYTARLLDFKSDLCKCSDVFNPACTALNTEGADTTYSSWRLEDIEEIVHERIRTNSSY